MYVPVTSKGPRLAATVRLPDNSGRQQGATVVFVHGVGCDRTQFVQQLEGLDPRLSLLTLDLPGHGESPELEDGDYSINSMADAIVSELSVRGHENSIIVGHSAGGLIALRIAVQTPELASAVLALDTNIALSGASLEANKARAERAEQGNWRDCFMASMEDAWGVDDGAAGSLRASVFHTLANTPERIARPFWHDALTINSEDLWRQCPVPSLYIQSKRETDLARLRALNPLITAIDMRSCCVGHWLQMQCPGPVNQALNEFLLNLEPSNDP